MSKAAFLVLPIVMMMVFSAETISPVISIMVQPSAAPTAVELSPATNVAENSALLSWSRCNDTDFSRYEVRRTTTSWSYGCSCTVVANIYAQNGTSLSSGGMNENTTYYFIVRVYNNEGTYANSNEIVVKTKASSADVTPPTITIVSPRNVTYDVQALEIEWNASETVVWTGYSIDGALPITVNGTATLEGLSVGRHLLMLYANDSSLNMGTASVSFTVSTDLTPPTILHSSPIRGDEGSQITLVALIMDDTVVAYARAYYRVAGQPQFAVLDLMKCPDCIDSYNATFTAPMGNDTSLEYYIVASDGNNTATSPSGAPAALYSIAINGHPPPVQGLTATNVTADSVLLEWDPSTAADFKSYSVYVSESPYHGASLAQITNRQTMFYIATDLKPNTTYYFWVRVYDTGALFQDSGEVTVKTMADAQVQPSGEGPSWLTQYGIYAAIGTIAVVSVVVLLLWRSGKIST